jgi:hypothetical protein
MAMQGMPEQDREGTAYLAAARKLRLALTERDKVVGRHRERYDRSQDDLRMMPESRIKVAAQFMQTALQADHIYEELVNEALEEYRELMSGGD